MSENRKKDHIELAKVSQTQTPSSDFIYEPLLSPHPGQMDLSLNFAGANLKAPMWISSMTGGTQRAQLINKNLTTIAGEFGFGMGLGSCRSLLESDERIKDFDFKHLIGDFPFYINLGIAQLEQLIEKNSVAKIQQLISKLHADGLVIHVNPLQEWFQPEGDRFKVSPIETIKSIVKRLDTKIIVKEVGQGFGPNSLKSLMELPIAAIELSGFGGTNFSLLELSRHNAQKSDNKWSKDKLVDVGHTCDQMINWINPLIEQESTKCKQFIISGGIKCLLDGYSLQEKLKADSVIGMASAFLDYAEDLDKLREFVASELESYKIARSYLQGK